MRREARDHLDRVGADLLLILVMIICIPIAFFDEISKRRF